MLFSEIEDAVLNGDVDLGVIIHENRFTYKEKGLEKLMDLGEYWEEQTQLPIPLGGIVVSKYYLFHYKKRYKGIETFCRVCL